ncbi:XRE family transcriptional regulator [Bartonella sp. CB74]|uniref:XRE family transcriptional regulator n=1 Tax=Bartonella sp. CB74 TaxID=3113620 RepID=UPI002F962EEE
MLTSFGKSLRKLRIDRVERLFDMAKKIGVSSAFLSSVEIGKKPIPSKMEEKIIEIYNLNQEVADLLRKEADICRKSFKVNASNPLSRETIGMFARVIDNLSEEKIMEVRQLIKEMEKESNE